MGIVASKSLKEVGKKTTYVLGPATKTQITKRKSDSFSNDHRF